MANPDFYLCDVCGEHTKHRFHPSTGRQMDGAGDYDDVGPTIDLCEIHMAAVVRCFLADRGNPRVPDYENGKQMVTYVDAMTAAQKPRAA